MDGQRKGQADRRRLLGLDLALLGLSEGAGRAVGKNKPMNRTASTNIYDSPILLKVEEK